MSFQKLAVVLIFALAFILRVNNLDRLPQKGETYDEYYWTFLGTSLIQNHTPIAWSFFDYPVAHSQTISGLTFQITQPNLDLPPLFSLVPGLWQTILGHTWNDPLPLATLRLPMVILGLINLYLFYSLCQKIFSPNLTLLATTIYGVTPTIVLGSRLIVADNLLITWALLLALFALSSSRHKLINFSIAALCAACVLTKTTGLGLCAGMFLATWGDASKKSHFALLGFLVGIALFILYGLIIDFHTFTSLLIQQASTRSVGFATFWIELFLKPKIANTLFLDGLILAATIALFFLFFHHPKEKWQKVISLFALCYLLFLCFTAGETTQIYHGLVNGTSLYGWYRFPLFPFMVISLTWLLANLWQEKNKLGLIALSFFFLLELRLLLFHLFPWHFELGLPKMLVRSTMALMIFSHLLPSKLWRIFFVLLLGLTLAVATAVSLTADPAKIFADANYLLTF